MSTEESTTTYKPVAGFPGYRVGDDGSVWSAWRHGHRRRTLTDHWKQMKLSPGTRGYLRVNLTPPGGGTYRTFRVHRLVLEAFVGPCPDGMECLHRNGVKTDCRLENLHWGTPDANRQDNHDRSVYARGTDHTQVVLTEEQVRAIRARYAAGGVFMRELAAEFGVTLSCISAIIYRVSWKHVD